jgi:predicted deacylase
LASGDAQHLYEFLVRRGYIEDASVPPLTNLAEQIGTPLTGVDMIEATVPGVLAWRVGPGDHVENGQLLGEIVNIDDVDAPRTPIYARTSGIVYGMRGYKLSVPGDIVIKVAGRENLEWRKGNLLTA